MFMRLLLIPLAALLFGAAAVGQDKKDALADFQKLPKEAKEILDGAEKFELYSLDPAGGMLKKGEESGGFHGWKVLGKTEIKDAGTLKKVRTAIDKGIAEGEGAAGCFIPRHGIRATMKDRTVDLVICFECVSMMVFVKDKTHAVWTSDSPQPTLDKILRDANVPLPKQKDD
jgi:hypothetical protein